MEFNIVLLVVAMTTSISSAAKLLLVPVLHHSHVGLFTEAGRHLKSRGHDVWIMAGESYEPKITKQGLNGIFHKQDKIYDFIESLDETDAAKAFLNGTYGINFIMNELFSRFPAACEGILGDDLVMNKVKDTGFDLALVDAVIPWRCILVMMYKYDIKFISLTPQLDPWSVGVAALPSAEPFVAAEMTNEMTFTQRALNTVMYTVLTVMGSRSTSELVEKYVPEKPPITVNELYMNAQMWLVNMETTCVDYPRVSGAHYRFIGGASASAARPLPDDLAEWVGNSTNGVVLMTFGSMKIFRAVVHEIQDKLFDAFSRLQQRVILQIDPAKVTRKIPGNVKCMSWLPQNDLLGHPKVRVFITHGGNNGQIESIYHGVPIITLPIMSEQAYNGLRAQNKNYGFRLDTVKFTSDELVTAINELINNRTYRDSVRKCSEILRSMPNAHDTLYVWVEHILRYGGKHLRPSNLDMNFITAFNLDVYAALLCILHIVLFIIYMLIKCTFNCIRRFVGFAPKQKTE